MKRFIILLLASLLTGCANAANPSSSSETAAPAGNTISLDDASGTVSITKPGTYTLSGTLADGQILVDAGKDDDITLILSGADITCQSSAPIYVKQAGNVTVTLADGTQNRLCDGAQYTFADGEDEPDAALFSKDDLILSGGGSLTIEANYKNGINSKDDLTIEGGSYTVTSAGDAVRGKDSVTISDGTFVLTAQQDGIQSNNDTDAGKGTVTISGGTFTITTGGGAAAQTDDAEESRKGVKAQGDLTITGGTFTIDSLDDAVHSNANVTIGGGSFSIATGDDGFHADNALAVDSGTIDISSSFEGLEGSTVEIGGGEITLVASDDGVNAAGGSDEAAGPGRMGPDSFASNPDQYIRVTGGSLTVDAQGDGLDSNGNLYLDGGAVLIHGPTGGGNGALDYSGECIVTGGILGAAGSSDMAQSVSDSSTQNALMIYFTQEQQAGTLIEIADASGNTVFSMTPSKQFQSLVVSAPELEQGAVYSISAGGTKLTDVTLSGVLTRISSDGSEVTGGMGGPGGERGMGGGGRGGMPPDGMSGMPPDGMDGERPQRQQKTIEME